MGLSHAKEKNQFDGNFGFEKKENVVGSSSANFLNRVFLTLYQNWRPKMQQQTLGFSKKRSAIIGLFNVIKMILIA